MIERKNYLEKLIGYKDKPIIKVITGIRRCGKSTILRLFQNYLKDHEVSENQIITVNFEDYDNEHLLEPHNLYNYILERILPDKTTYIFLDEVQNVSEFQKVVNSLYLKENLDIYLTGSNAYLLSGELATLLTGRYVTIEMLPMSFQEFVSAKANQQNTDELYLEYIETSSFPYIVTSDQEKSQIKDYLTSLYSTVVVKDIMTRRKLTDIMMLESVLRFLMDNIGNQLSTKKISDTLTANGRSINVKTVESYISAFMESYVMYEAKRYHIKGRQYLKTLEKYYIVDIGLRNAMLGSKGRDSGHILENIIYLELIRRGYEVYIGKIDEVEVDFVCINENNMKYIQVSASVRDENTLERELRPLQKINDHYPKYILTLDRDPIADYNGIKIINALDFLLYKFEI